jgi:GT2 family glycosyltransferase
MNSVIILNWNTTQLLINLYESMKQHSFSFYELIIVDNGSITEEYEKLTEYFRMKWLELTGSEAIEADTELELFSPDKMNIKIRGLEKNIGFGAGNNVALSMVDEKSENVIFINSDILIQEDNWDKKFDEILSQENVGVAGCAYHPLTWDRNGQFKIHLKTNQPVESESVQGAFFAIKKSVLDKVKVEDGCWFDENFKFAQYEETDLHFRIIEKGFKCIHFPLKHEHLHNQSSTKKNGYNLCDEIKNINEFKANAERNKQLLIKKHKAFFESK